MPIDQTAAHFRFDPAKTEIKTVAKGAIGLLLFGLLVGPAAMAIGGYVILADSVPGGVILLAGANALLSLGSAMIIAVFGLHLHLNLLRAIESVQATAATHRDEHISEIRADLQRIREQDRQLADLLTGAAKTAGNEVGRRRDEHRD